MWAVVLRRDGIYEVGQADTLKAKLLGIPHDLVAVSPEKYMAVVIASCCSLILSDALVLTNAQKEIVKAFTEIEDGLNGI
jgi:hypothetical protein